MEPLKAITLTEDQAEKLVAPFGLTDKVIVLGIRGYNDPGGVDQIGIYDDCIAIIAPGFFGAYNANTDPSRALPGVATLQPGTYEYARGLHGIHHLDLNNLNDKALYNKLIATNEDLAPIPGRILPYWALRQHGNVTIIRQGSAEPITDSPANRFWIDIHKGGYNTTSSAGCQTIYPDQWPTFRDHIFTVMKEFNQPIVNYILIDAAENREILAP